MMRRILGIGFAVAALYAGVLGITATATLGARFVIDDEHPANVGAQPTSADKPAAAKPVPAKRVRALPEEVRGIHVTMALASLDGKLAEYLKLVDESGVRPACERGRCGEALLPAARGSEADPPQGRLPDRPCRHLRGSAALRGQAGARDQESGRLRLAQPRGSRLDEPLRQAGLGLQRLDRRGRSAGRVRRDPVRLRPLPDRR